MEKFNDVLSASSNIIGDLDNVIKHNCDNTTIDTNELKKIRREVLELNKQIASTARALHAEFERNRVEMAIVRQLLSSEACDLNSNLHLSYERFRLSSSASMGTSNAFDRSLNAINRSKTAINLLSAFGSQRLHGSAFLSDVFIDKEQVTP
jgi:hypothetical protein